MTTKEHLERYKSWHHEKLNLLDEREHIITEEAMPAGIDYSAEKVQTSPEDGMLKKILRIKRRTEEIDKRVEKLTLKMEKLKDTINAVPAPSNRLLYLRYIELMEWEDVGKSMGYSEDHVKGPLHMKSLADFEKITRNTTE